MFSLIVTAVGSLLCLVELGNDRECARDEDISSGVMVPQTGLDMLSRLSSGSGCITVPPPRGFSTFFILIGISRLIT